MLEGGRAYNALPQAARATVNCRIMPGEPANEIKATLVRVLADDQIAVTQIGEPILSAPSALHEKFMGVIGKLSAEFWPGAPIVPTMSGGATDGSYLRNAGIPTYGHSGLASTTLADLLTPRLAANPFSTMRARSFRLPKLFCLSSFRSTSSPSDW
jgi:acetylornithine deacetylase/succinyl-diaminopimelate desuccinylase-like protein